MCRYMQLVLGCQITTDRMLAGARMPPPVWSSATKTHPSSLSIWQPLSEGRSARKGVQRLQVPLGWIKNSRVLS